MQRKTTMGWDRNELPSPPLFVSAMTNDGKRHQCLLEKGMETPEWFKDDIFIRVEAPSGMVRDHALHHASPQDGYTECLDVMGSVKAWVPENRSKTSSPKLDVWASSPGTVEPREGYLIELHRDPSAGDPLGAPEHDITCYAVVRNHDGSSAYVPNSGRFYFDVSDVENGKEVVPRALLDTGLAGAFWGFVQHHNKAASLLVAKRLLAELFEECVLQADSVSVAASAHAMLSHRELLPEYGTHVMSALSSGILEQPDAKLLKAVIGMVQLSTGASDRDSVKDAVRQAIAALAEGRPTYGETISWLDSKFSILRELVLRDYPGPKTRADVDAIASWLRSSYAGGQVAAYKGDLPAEAKAGWHHVASAEKKSPQS